MDIHDYIHPPVIPNAQESIKNKIYGYGHKNENKGAQIITSEIYPPYNETTVKVNQPQENGVNDIIFEENENSIAIVNFKDSNNVYYPKVCKRKDYLRDICDEFANHQQKKFIFKYRGRIINQNKTVGQFLKENRINRNGMTIDVEIDQPCYLKHKKKIIIGISILGVLVVGGIIVASIVSKK